MKKQNFYYFEIVALFLSIFLITYLNIFYFKDGFFHGDINGLLTLFYSHTDSILKFGEPAMWESNTFGGSILYFYNIIGMRGLSPSAAISDLISLFFYFLESETNIVNHYLLLQYIEIIIFIICIIISINTIFTDKQSFIKIFVFTGMIFSPALMMQLKDPTYIERLGFVIMFLSFFYQVVICYRIKLINYFYLSSLLVVSCIGYSIAIFYPVLLIIITLIFFFRKIRKNIFNIIINFKLHFITFLILSLLILLPTIDALSLKEEIALPYGNGNFGVSDFVKGNVFQIILSNINNVVFTWWPSYRSDFLPSSIINSEDIYNFGIYGYCGIFSISCLFIFFKNSKKSLKILLAFIFFVLISFVYLGEYGDFFITRFLIKIIVYPVGYFNHFNDALFSSLIFSSLVFVQGYILSNKEFINLKFLKIGFFSIIVSFSYLFFVSINYETLYLKSLFHIIPINILLVFIVSLYLIKFCKKEIAQKFLVLILTLDLILNIFLLIPKTTNHEEYSKFVDKGQNIYGQGARQDETEESKIHYIKNMFTQNAYVKSDIIQIFGENDKRKCLIYSKHNYKILENNIEILNKDKFESCKLDFKFRSYTSEKFDILSLSEKNLIVLNVNYSQFWNLRNTQRTNQKVDIYKCFNSLVCFENTPNGRKANYILEFFSKKSKIFFWISRIIVSLFFLILVIILLKKNYTSHLLRN